MATTLNLSLTPDARRRSSHRALDHARNIESELGDVLRAGAAPPQLASVREIAEGFRGVGFTEEEREAIAALRRRPYARPITFED